MVGGQNPGSKLDKAESFGVPVLDEDGLAVLLSEGPDAAAGEVARRQPASAAVIIAGCYG